MRTSLRPGGDTDRRLGEGLARGVIYGPQSGRIDLQCFFAASSRAGVSKLAHRARHAPSCAGDQDGPLARAAQDETEKARIELREGDLYGCASA